jgi:hypothetical protein
VEWYRGDVGKVVGGMDGLAWVVRGWKGAV